MTIKRKNIMNILIGSCITGLLLVTSLYTMLHYTEIIDSFPTQNQFLAWFGFVVAAIVILISGIYGIMHLIRHARGIESNVTGAFIGIFFFILTISLLCLYGEQLYYATIVYDKSPDLRLFSGYTCAKIQNINNMLEYGPFNDFYTLSDKCKWASIVVHTNLASLIIWNGTKLINSTTGEVIEMRQDDNYDFWYRVTK